MEAVMSDSQVVHMSGAGEVEAPSLAVLEARLKSSADGLSAVEAKQRLDSVHARRGI
jgi:hypothetical protein